MQGKDLQAVFLYINLKGIDLGVSRLDLGGQHRIKGPNGGNTVFDTLLDNSAQVEQVLLESING
jgi:hypothetical protein